jgi:hypothetical protein
MISPRRVYFGDIAVYPSHVEEIYGRRNNERVAITCKRLDNMIIFDWRDLTSVTIRADTVKLPYPNMMRQLTRLHIDGDNPLDWLEKLPALSNLRISGNRMKEFKYRLPNLRRLSITSCYIKHIDLSPYVNAKYIDVAANDLYTVNVGYLPELRTLIVADNVLRDLDVTRLPNLKHLNIGYNKLTWLNIDANKRLKRLNVMGNRFDPGQFNVPIIMSLHCRPLDRESIKCTPLVDSFIEEFANGVTL